jgi:hypothetical protein
MPVKINSLQKITNMKKFLILASVVLIAACSKDQQAPAPGDTPMKAADFLAKYQVKEQTFKGSAALGFTITGEKGTKITFPLHAFKDSATGADVNIGDVEIKLIEVLSKKDILLSGPMTESNGQLLVSGGEIRVRAKLNGAVLVPGDSAIKVEVPMVMKAGDMNLFVQAPRKVADNNVPPGFESTWVPAPYAPFGMGASSYIFTLPAFTWVNCDRFYSDPAPKTTITVSPDFMDSDSISGLQVMIIFKDITTVITLPFNYTLVQFQSYDTSLPIGKEGELVLIGKDENGNLEFGTQHITISANMHIDAPIARSTEATVSAFLNTVQ